MNTKHRDLIKSFSLIPALGIWNNSSYPVLADNSFLSSWRLLSPIREINKRAFIMRRWRLLPGWIPGDILSSASQPRAVTQHSSMPRGGHSNSPTRAGSEAAPLRRALLARAGARQMLALFTNPSARDFLVHKHSQMEKNIHTHRGYMQKHGRS